MCCSHLFPEEAHPDVVPELRGVGRRKGSHAVLHQRHVHVAVVLDDGSGSEDGLGVGGVVGEAVPEEVKRLVVFSHAQIQQPWRGGDGGTTRRDQARLTTQRL